MARPAQSDCVITGKHHVSDSPCAKCGEVKRYKSTRGCVRCAKLAAAKQRARFVAMRDADAPGHIFGAIPDGTFDCITIPADSLGTPPDTADDLIGAI